MKRSLSRLLALAPGPAQDRLEQLAVGFIITAQRRVGVVQRHLVRPGGQVVYVGPFPHRPVSGNRIAGIPLLSHVVGVLKQA